MRNGRRFVLPFAALCAGVAAFALAGCSSDPEGPAPFGDPAGTGTATGPGQRDDAAYSTPEERAELDALEIGADEPILDEGDLDGAEAGTTELLDNPVEDDEELAPEVDTSDVLPASHALGLPGANVGSHPITGSVFECIDGKKNSVTAPRAVRTFAETSYVVKSAKDFGLDPRTYTWTQLPSQAFAAAKISPGDGSKSVKDYLLRDGNVINLAYNTPRVGGVATDTLAVGDHTLGFHRVKSTKKRPALIYSPTDLASRPRIIFAYGELAGRFGWLALPAFMKGRAVTPPSNDACDGRPDGGYCTTILGNSGFVCKGGKTVQTATCPADKPLCVGPGENGAPLRCDG
jgi:hypothetical protein